MERINLDALEAALAKATPGEWKWSINGKRVQVAAVRHAAQVCAVWNTSAHPATAVADAIVATHNALPALIAELRELRKEAARARWCEEARAVELDSKTGIAPEVLEGLLPDSAWLAQREREAAAKAEAVAVKLLGQLADEHATGREPRQSYTTGYQDALFHTHDKIRERIAAAIDAARGGGQ